jgi:hypothetical protein
MPPPLPPATEAGPGRPPSSTYSSGRPFPISSWIRGSTAAAATPPPPKRCACVRHWGGDTGGPRLADGILRKNINFLNQFIFSYPDPTLPASVISILCYECIIQSILQTQNVKYLVVGPRLSVRSSGKDMRRTSFGWNPPHQLVSICCHSFPSRSLHFSCSRQFLSFSLDVFIPHWFSFFVLFRPSLHPLVRFSLFVLFINFNSTAYTI